MLVAVLAGSHPDLRSKAAKETSNRAETADCRDVTQLQVGRNE